MEEIMLLNNIIESIINEQSQIVGDKLAKSRALASGVIQYGANGQATISNVEPSQALEKLIASYKEIFGQSSVDVCIDILKKFPYQDISQYLPSSIKDAIN